MSAYQTQYYSTAVMFQIADVMHAAADRLRSSARALYAWLEMRRRAAVARHEFEKMSDHCLRDIGLSRADVLRVALCVERAGDVVELAR